MIGLALLLAALSPGGVDDRVMSEPRRWEQRYPMATATPQLTVRNVWGPVTVDVHDQPTILVRALERRAARDQQTLERSSELLFLRTEQSPDTLELAVDGVNRQWYRDDPCPGCELRLELHITVPRGATLDVATVMNGAVEVADVTGQVSARNVNGAVRVDGIQACGQVESVNGEVQVTFAHPPQHQYCRIETINGDMQLALPGTGDADIEFRLGHGTISSELEIQPLALPARVEREADGSAARYRVVQPAAVRLGQGGARFHFSSMNGDVRIVRAVSR